MVFPTKKIIPIFIICLIVLGGIFALLEYKNRGKTINNEGVISVTDQKLIDSIATKDTDHDGLKDWEEALWETNPNNPDTDADGTKDGAEIAANRDPLKKGPNDKLEEPAANKIAAAQPLTESDQFSRDLFTRYITIKQSGSGDPADFSNYSDLVDSYIEKETATQNIKTYGAGDFTVVDETTASIHRYGNVISDILTKEKPTPMENELTILQRATENNSPDELKKLDANLAAYRKVVAGLLAAAVPRNFLPSHLALTNAAETIIAGIEAMKLTFSDPIKAVAGLKNYPDAAGNFMPLVREIQQILIEKGAIYAESEAGWRFVNNQ